MSIALAKPDAWDEYVEAWHHWTRQATTAASLAAWEKGAIALSLDPKYGDGATAKFAKEVGVSERSVRVLAQVCRAFENGRRLPNLSFYHHLAALSATDPLAALQDAERENWSVRKLRAHVKSPAHLPAATCNTGPGTCGPITTDDKIFHISALIENFYAVKGYEIEPLVRVGTKKSLRDLSKKVSEVIGWLQALNESIKQRNNA